MKKRILVYAVLAAIILGGSAGLYMYYKPHKEYGQSTPDVTATAREMLSAFENDELKATDKFVADDKTVLVTGSLQEISSNEDGTMTLTLADTGMEGSIICRLAQSESAKWQSLQKGSTVRVKGQCTGLQELLDKEVVMIRCVIVE